MNHHFLGVERHISDIISSALGQFQDLVCTIFGNKDLIFIELFEVKEKNLAERKSSQC